METGEQDNYWEALNLTAFIVCNDSDVADTQWVLCNLEAALNDGLQGTAKAARQLEASEVAVIWVASSVFPRVLAPCACVVLVSFFCVRVRVFYS